jgi:hypothetical protein
MKSLIILASSLTAFSTLALSLPVSEDTSSNTRGQLTSNAGKAATLLVNSNQNAFLQFDLSTLPASFAPTNITSARLKLYIVNSRNPGDMTVSAVTSPWMEAASSNTPIPTFDPTILSTVTAPSPPRT